MTAFEALKSFFHPRITLWQSHTVTIIFSGCVAAIAAVIALRKQSRLHLHLLAEIHERRQTETRLRENQEFQEWIINTVSDFLYQYDAVADRIVYVNEKLQTLLGRNARTFPLTGTTFFGSFVHPEDVSRAMEQHTDALSATAGAIVKAEYRLRGADGSWRWVQSRASIFPKAGERHASLISHALQDITERKAAEDALQQNYQLLRAVIDGASDVIFVKDLKGHYLLMNSAGAHRLERSVEDIVGKTDDDLYAPDEAQRLHSSDLRALLSQAPETTEEVFTTAEGKRTYQTTRVVYRNARDNILGLLGISRDITERKQLAEALRRAHETLETRVQERTEELTQINTTLQQRIAKAERGGQNPQELAVMQLQRLQSLAIEPTLDQYFADVLPTITQQLHVFSAALYLYDLANDLAHLHLQYWHGQVCPGWQGIGEAENLPVDFIASQDPMVLALAESRAPLLIDHVADSATLRPDLRAWAVRAGIQSILIVPFLLEGKLVGAFSVRSQDRRQFRSEEIELVQGLAQQATLALQITRLAEQGKRVAVLEERNRMAREIHDTLSQGFTGIIVQLEAAEDALEVDTDDVEGIRRHITNARTLARESLAEARRSVWELRSRALVHGHLPDALFHEVTRITAGTGLQGDFQLHGAPRALPAAIEEHLLRIGQEALTNVLRHAQAQTVRVALTFSPYQVLMCVEDDGHGAPTFQSNERGFGLVSMQERAERLGGSLVFSSEPGQGAKLIVMVPLPVKPVTVGADGNGRKI
jgi:PAS domain S-box-containing protein